MQSKPGVVIILIMKAVSIIQQISIFLLIQFFLFINLSGYVHANPYFYITGQTSVSTSEVESFQVRLNADSAVGVLQIVVHYSSTYFNTSSISISNSRCSLWAPPNSAPPGKDLTSVTPYFYNSTAVIACGFTGAGYQSSDGLIATINLTPILAGNTTLSFSDSYLAFLGSSITPGAMAGFDVVISGAPTPTESPTPNPSVTPTLTPIPTAVPTDVPEVTATAETIINSQTLFDDVTIVDVTDNLTSGSSGSSATSIQGESELEVVDQVDTVPAAPANLPQRATATPFKVPEINYQSIDGTNEQIVEDGEVLSVQGLRDLLIPGKSKADKTVVMINFVSLFAFIVLLAIMLWKMNLNKRAAKIRAEHINELVTGELAALESKMQVIYEKKGAEDFEGEFSEAVSHILTGFGKKDKSESK